jgi:hypothetical protein
MPGDYENCLDDINRALTFELPQKTRKRLEYRKAKCEILLRMNSPSQPRGSSEDTEVNSQDAELRIRLAFIEAVIWQEKAANECCSTSREKLKAVSLDDGETHEDPDGAVTSEHVETVKLKKSKLKQPVPPKLTGAPSAKVATASNRLDCTYSEESGRHFVAAVNIEPGFTV